MMRKDYLLRLIDQLGHVLARIMTLNRNGNPVEAQARIEEAMKCACGLPRDVVEHLSPAALVTILMADKPVDDWWEQGCILVRLLHEQALVYRAEACAEPADNADLKALYLLFAMQARAPAMTFLSVTPAVAELVAGVSPGKLPSSLVQAVVRDGTLPPEAPRPATLR